MNMLRKLLVREFGEMKTSTFTSCFGVLETEGLEEKVRNAVRRGVFDAQMDNIIEAFGEESNPRAYLQLEDEEMFFIGIDLVTGEVAVM